jgi:type II secretory pathway pseudopilin PulG
MSSVSCSRRTSDAGGRDRGAVLVLVLVVGVVLSMVVIALAQYTSSTLRHGQVSEARADRLAAADAAMSEAIERLRLGRSLCTTGAGSSNGITYRFPVALNGAAVDVSCRRLGPDLSEIAGWAIVVTGAGGVPQGRGLVTSSGAGTSKLLGGPVFVADLSLLGLSAPVELRDGDLWYSDPLCASSSEYTGLAVENLEFVPDGVRGSLCTDLTWDEIYVEPPVPDLDDFPPGDPDGFDIGACKVFEPGRYSQPPRLAANNYFMSGDYLFEDVQLAVKQSTVTAGKPGAGGAIQELDNAPCDTARDADPAADGMGATFYLSGTSNIVSLAHAALEVMPRLQGNTLVSIQALPSSSLRYTDDVVGTAPGDKKQLVLHGLLWAPHARLTLGEATNRTAAQLTGGAVCAAADIGASASSVGFVVQVEGSPATTEMLLTSRAELRGTSVVEVVAEARFTDPDNGAGAGTWEIAVRSWRVDGAAS